MSEKRRGLGRGIGALIPSGPTQGSTMARPIDVFFASSESATSSDEAVLEATAATRSSAEQPAVGPSEGPTPRTLAPTDSASGSDGASGDNGSPASRGDAEDADPARPAADDGHPAEDGQDVSTVGRGPADPGTGGASPDAPTGSAAPGAPTGGAAPGAATGGAATGVDDGGLVPVPGATFAEIPVGAIAPNARQPRQAFDEDELEELATSIREVGVLQPVVVRRAGGDGEASYELIMGERRWRASQLAGNATVPAIVRETGDDALLRDALLENLHRAQLNPLEEAAAYQQLLEDFACTHDELAARIARSRPQISNTLRLLKLPPLVQRRVAAGVLSAGHARALLGLADGAAMERLAQRIVAEGLSVRATEEIVALGDEPVQPEMRRRPRAGAHSETLERLASRLTDHLDTRVKVTMGQRKGRIAIEFAGIEDLDRILASLGEQPTSTAPDQA